MGQALTLQRHLNSIFEEAGRSTASLLEGDSFVPLVDIFEDDQKVVMKFEVPGMKQEDLDIRIENKTLHVSGERKFETETSEQNYHRIERRYGSFARSFTLPETVDAEKVQASYDAGILTVEMAKRAEAKPKQIKIAVGGAEPRQVEGSTESKSAK
jgi:HSP20 family protein